MTTSRSSGQRRRADAGLGPVRMRILEDGSTTGHRLGIGEITIAPHTEGPPQHRHGRHDEGFYVVSGTARFTVADQAYDAGPGSLVMSAGCTAHIRQPRRPAGGPAQYVHARSLRPVLPRPAGHIAAGQPLTGDAAAGVMARYATVPATDFAS